jgi:hypothetical protein
MSKIDIIKMLYDRSKEHEEYGKRHLEISRKLKEKADQLKNS